MTVDHVSAVGPVQDRLAELLASRPALGGVRVDVGWPAGGPVDEHIWISGDVETWEQVWSTSGDGGPAGIDETFTLTVVVFVRRSTVADLTYRRVRDRARLFLGELQAQLRETHDLTLGGLVQLATITGGTWSEGVEEDARAVMIEVRVSVTAYLTLTG